jgi:hypothetical protein
MDDISRQQMLQRKQFIELNSPWTKGGQVTSNIFSRKGSQSHPPFQQWALRPQVWARRHLKHRVRNRIEALLGFDGLAKGDHSLRPGPRIREESQWGFLPPQVYPQLGPYVGPYFGNALTLVPYLTCKALGVISQMYLEGILYHEYPP